MPIYENFKFIDLFAGIGGFHIAMKRYTSTCECVMASEIDEDAKKVYKDNFNIDPLGDICKIDPKKIEKYDVICGGFPCQTFSKAGKRAGFKDPRGTLFNEIVRLAKSKKRISDRPKLLILENVRNLISHDSGDTWKTIRYALEKAGYNVIKTPIILGPKDIGVPQIRDRAIIVAVRKDLYNGEIELNINRRRINSTNIYSIIDTNLADEERESCILSDHQLKVLECWDDFYHTVEDEVIGHPIWSDEFKKTYSLIEKNEKGEFKIPEWKQEFIQWNRDFYKRNKTVIDKWYEKWDIKSWTTATERKFEWQCGKNCKSVWEGIIQFRTSGVRVKKPTESPTLVSMNHRPIIGSERRYITVKEAAKLQSFPNNYKFNETDEKAFKQLGNAVNADVIKYVFETFIDYLYEKGVEL